MAKLSTCAPSPIGPMALAADQQNIWVAALDAGVLQSLPVTGSAQGQTIGRVGRPTGVAFGAGQLWVSDAPDQTVNVIDPVSGATNRTLATPAAAIEFGAGAAWDVDDITDSIHRLDAQSGDVVATIALDQGAYPNAISVTGDAVWVSNGGTQHGQSDRSQQQRHHRLCNSVALRARLDLCWRPSGLGGLARVGLDTAT